MTHYALASALDEYLAAPPQPSDQRAINALLRLRESISAEVDKLIGLLDVIDGDPDLEPSLSGTQAYGYDLEDQCEDEGAQCEDEGAQCDDEGEDSDAECNHRFLKVA